METTQTLWPNCPWNNSLPRLNANNTIILRTLQDMQLIANAGSPSPSKIVLPQDGSVNIYDVIGHFLKITPAGVYLSSVGAETGGQISRSRPVLCCG